MVHVLIVSSEPRLVDALRSNLEDDAVVRTALDAESAQNLLFQNNFDLALIDFEALRNEPFETFIAIDNVLTTERTSAALLIRKPSATANTLTGELSSLQRVIDLSRGRPHFDDTVRLLYSQAMDAYRTLGDDTSSSNDRLARREIDLPALNEGDLLDTSLARLLYTLHQRKESGLLTLRYSTTTLRFGVQTGDLVVGSGHASRDDLLGAFAWSHGTHAFDASNITGTTQPMLEIIAEGCRKHMRQSKITEAMSPIMRRYAVPTNLWDERSAHFADYPILNRVMEACDGSTKWERVLSSLGDEVSDGFRAAYFALQLDLVHTVEQEGLVGIAVNYSREVRQARQRVDQAEIEKTKAYQATSGSGRSQLERELGVLLKQLRQANAHGVLGVWEGCGRKVVQDRFYVLVKEHHPDVYGGNTSGNVKSLAQDIFILIKDSYQKLLSIEKQQTVPPPAAGQFGGPRPLSRPAIKPLAPELDSEPNPEPQHRPRLETPRVKAITSPGYDQLPREEKVDVRSKLATLSGFKKKQQTRKRLNSYSGRSEAEEDPVLAEESSEAIIEIPVELTEEESAAKAASEAEEAEVQRQAKLEHLLRRAQTVDHPDAPDPAKDFFSKGYHAFRESKIQDAQKAFAKAHELAPEDSTYLTFHAYTMYLLDSNKRDEAEKMLRTALQAGNRQAAPDACLFLGMVLKARGETNEAYKLFKRAYALNPTSREAERELRLAERRLEGRQKSDPAKFIKSLFKK